MRPISSWPKRAWAGIPSSVDIGGRGEAAAGGGGGVAPPPPAPPPLLAPRAIALGDGPEGLVGRDGGADLVVVPGVLGLGRLLDLEQVGGVDLPAVGPDHTLAEERVVGRRLLHLRDPPGP